MQVRGSLGAELGCRHPRCDMQRRGMSDIGWAAQPAAVGVAGAREEEWMGVGHGVWCRRGGVGSLGALVWAAAALAVMCSGVGCQMLGGLRLTSAVGDGHHRAVVLRLFFGN